MQFLLLNKLIAVIWVGEYFVYSVLVTLDGNIHIIKSHLEEVKNQQIGGFILKRINQIEGKQKVNEGRGIQLINYLREEKNPAELEENEKRSKNDRNCKSISYINYTIWFILTTWW